VWGGILCHARGNYGSHVYDPINDEGKYLEFCICDQCLEKKAKLINWIQIRTIHEVEERKKFDKKLKEGGQF
jgi:hypothetical protein